jgi:antitoxin component YwqK of YwqJK toxin-antitoxin module
VQYKGSIYPLNYVTYKVDWHNGCSFDRGTGNPRCIGTWIGGKLHGENIEIYENTGKLMSVGNYVEGQLKWSKEWNKEGKLRLEAYWRNSRWQGIVKRYGPNEELIYEGGYENGVKEGLGLEYWDEKSTNGVK